MTVYTEIEKLDDNEFYKFITWLDTTEKPRRVRLQEEANRQIETLIEFRDKGLLKSPTPADGYPGFYAYSPDIIYLPGECVVVDGAIYKMVSRCPSSAPIDDSKVWLKGQ